MNYHCDKCGQHFPLCEMCEKNQAVTTSIHSYTAYLCPECARKIVLFLRDTKEYLAFIMYVKAYDLAVNNRTEGVNIQEILESLYKSETDVGKLIHQYIKDNRPSTKAKILHLVRKDKGPEAA